MTAALSYIPALIALAGIHLLAVASPGPAFFATLQITAQHDRRTSFMHALGLGLAATVWAASALWGLQELMRRVAWLYRAIEFCGGGYLIYIGVQSWRHAKDAVVINGESAGRSLSAGAAFRRGFGTNIANPKVMVFFAGIFAALLDPRWPSAVRLAALCIVAFDETGWFALLTFLLYTKGAQIAYQRVRRFIDRVAGTFLILFGAKLFWNSLRSPA